jgi:hypothetical protein
VTAQTWQFITSVFNGSAPAGGGTPATAGFAGALCCAGPRGVTLAVTLNSNFDTVSVYKSIDGGRTWALVNSAVIGYGGDFSLVWGGGTNWYIVMTPGQLYYSSNDGTTWTATSSGVFGGQCPWASAYDGSNTVMFQDVSQGKVEWLTGTATGGNTVTSATFPVGSQGGMGGSANLLWDGTNFVAINENTAGTSYQLLTAPSGFTQGAGPTWTVQASLAIGSPILGAGGLPNFGFVPGIGYVTSYATNGVNFATSYSGILNNTGLQTPLGSTGSAYSCFGAGQLFFVGNGAGAMAESSNGTLWTADTPNFAVAGEYLVQAVYDLLHNAYIILGSNCSLCVGSIIPPFGRGLPQVTGGQSLSPNPNSVAGAQMAQTIVNGFPQTTANVGKPTSTTGGGQPIYNVANPVAGLGGDKWGAYGGGQTPIGGGVFGPTGYDRPIAVTVADCERAANYIVSGGQNQAGAPISVVGAQADAALPATTFDDTLPTGDSTTGNVG